MHPPADIAVGLCVVGYFSWCCRLYLMAHYPQSTISIKEDYHAADQNRGNGAVHGGGIQFYIAQPVEPSPRHMVLHRQRWLCQRGQTTGDRSYVMGDVARMAGSRGTDGDYPHWPDGLHRRHHGPRRWGAAQAGGIQCGGPQLLDNTSCCC